MLTLGRVQASLTLHSLNHNLAVLLGLVNPLGNDIVEELLLLLDDIVPTWIDEAKKNGKVVI